MKPLSEVAPRLFVIQIQIQAGLFNSKLDNYHVREQLNYQWYQFKHGVYLSWRTPYDPEKATNEYSKSNKMCPDIEGFIMNPKPTRVKKRLLNFRKKSQVCAGFFSTVYAPYVESIIKNVKAL